MQREIDMWSFPIVMTVTGCCATLIIRTIRISNRKMPASDTREVGLCATPDNSVNIESPKWQFIEAANVIAWCFAADRT
jgi:hypothetical protein